MGSIKSIILLSAIVYSTHCYSQDLAVTSRPLAKIGERVLSFGCPMDGNQQKDIEIWVYYSNNRSKLSDANCPRARATCRKNPYDPTRLSCRFYFPHDKHPRPNFLTYDEKNGKDGLTENEDITFRLDAANTYKPEFLEFGSGITDVNPQKINHPDSVYYKVVRKVGSARKSSAIFSFKMPRLFIIGYIGDSYAAGEGAPYSRDDKWDNDLCHRSNNSGGMRGINQYIKAHADLSIKVFNATCSGAIVENLIARPQHESIRNASAGFSQMENSINFSQLGLLENWLSKSNRKTVDILLMGVGGNNIGFAPLVTAAISPGSWGDLDSEQAATLSALDRLPGLYTDLNTAIQNQTFEVSKVLMMNYPNMLYGINNKICDGNYLVSTSVYCVPNAITNQFFGHIQFFKDVYTRLNRRVEDAARSHGWQLINVSQINSHGLCNCREPYFNTVGVALSMHDLNYAIHPNADGYEEMYKDKVYTGLKTAVEQAQEIAKAKARAEALDRARERAAEKAREANLANLKKRYEGKAASAVTKAEVYLKGLRVDSSMINPDIKFKLKHDDNPDRGDDSKKKDGEEK